MPAHGCATWCLAKFTHYGAFTAESSESITLSSWSTVPHARIYAPTQTSPRTHTHSSPPVNTRMLPPRHFHRDLLRAARRFSISH